MLIYIYALILRSETTNFWWARLTAPFEDFVFRGTLVLLCGYFEALRLCIINSSILCLLI